MTKNQWRIALAGIAIVVTAQFVQMLHGIELREVVLSENGHVFASSSYRKPIATSIYHWQPGLSARERIIDSPLPVHSLACTANGQLLLYIKGPVLEGWDLKTKDKRWTFAEGRMKHADLFPCMSDQFTLIVENAIWNDTTSNRPPIMHLIRNADGYYVGEIGDAMFASVLCVGDTLNYQDRFSVRKAVRVQQPSSVEPKIVPATTELNGRQVTVWDGTRRKRLRHQNARGDLEVRYSNTASSVPNRIKLSNRSNGKSLGDRWVSLKLAHRWVISLVTAGLLVVWCCLLNIDAQRDLSDRRLWTDAAILGCVVLLLGINLPSKFGIGEAVAHPNVKAATVLIGIAISLLFILPLATNRRLHRWGMFLVACAFPMLAPVFGLAAILHQCGLQFVLHPKETRRIAMVPEVFQSKSPQVDQPARVASGLRFGIQEMMWVTAGIAIFIAVGWMSLMMIPLGTFFAVALGVAAWMSHHPVSANLLNAFALAILYLMPGRLLMLDGVIPTGLLLASIGLVFGFLGTRSRHLASDDHRPSRTGHIAFDRTVPS